MTMNQQEKTTSSPFSNPSILNVLFDQLPASVAIIDPNYRVVRANEMYKRNFGDAEGKYCFEVQKKQNKICETCLADQVFADGGVRFETKEMTDKDGNQRVKIVFFSPLKIEGEGIPYIIEMTYDVTEAFRTRHEYDALFETAPCFVSVIDKDLRIVRANRQLKDIFGNVEGQQCYRAYKARLDRCEDCPVLEVFKDGQPKSSSHTGISRTGERKKYLVNAIPLHQGTNGVDLVMEMSLDITEREQLSESFQRENLLRRALTRSTTDALVAVDERNIVRLFNPAAEKLFGEQAEETIDRPLANRFFPKRFAESIEAGKDSIILPEIEISIHDEEHIPVRFAGTVLKNDEGKTIGRAAFFQDLREMKRLEQEKLESERLAAVGKTVAEIAHALKNILTGMQGGIYKIKRGEKKDSVEMRQKGWEIFDRNFTRIISMVKDLLNLSKSHEPNYQTLDAREIVKDVYNLFLETARQKQVVLDIQTPNKPLQAALDAEDMHMALSNLIGNAIDACTTSEKSDCKTTIRVYEEGADIAFEIQDTGCGMTEETRQKLFDQFYTTKGVNGSGLGLPVTKKVIREHNGEIEVESVPNEGTTFKIKIPLATNS